MLCNLNILSFYVVFISEIPESSNMWANQPGMQSLWLKMPLSHYCTVEYRVQEPCAEIRPEGAIYMQELCAIIRSKGAIVSIQCGREQCAIRHMLRSMLCLHGCGGTVMIA